MARNAPTDDEVSRAKGVLERAYNSWVSDLVGDLLYECYVEDIDEEQLNDMISERTDSGLVYTADQWVTLFASRNTQEGWDDLRGMGSHDTEDPVAAWAVLTYQRDVNDEFWDSPLLEPIRDGQDLEERVQWLIEEHGGAEYPLNPNLSAYIVGEPDGRVNFGILVIAHEQEDGERVWGEHQFVGRSLEPENLHVLMDLILEEGGNVDSPRVRDFLSKAARSG